MRWLCVYLLWLAAFHPDFAQHSDDTYYTSLYSSGRYRWLPLLQEVVSDYQLYTRIIAAASNLACPLRLLNETGVLPNVTSSVSPSVSHTVRDWCGQIESRLVHPDNVVALLDTWTLRRDTIQTLMPLCYPNLSPTGIKTPEVTDHDVTLSSGFTFTARIPTMNCVCRQYDLSLHTDQSGKRRLQAYTTSACDVGTRLTLTEVGYLPNLTSLTLYNLPLFELSSTDLALFPSLLLLRFTEMALVTEGLANGLLCRTPRLRIFWYDESFGNLRQFPNQIFNCSDRMNLDFVFFDNHAMSRLPAHAFGQASSKLRFLVLQNCGLRSIDRHALDGLDNIEYLSLLHNSIAFSFPADELMPALPRLVYFSLLVNAASAHDLDLAKTLSLPGQESARFFVWSFSRVTSVTGRFCSEDGRSMLELIGLSNNWMSSIDEHAFRNCSELRFIQLNNNSLSNVSLSHLPKLESVNLAFNHFDDHVMWNAVLAGTPELLYLNISGNRLSSWTQSLAHVPGLLQLDLSFNNISFVDTAAFASLRRLQFVSLVGNALHSLDAHLYRHLPMLTGLVLRDNLLDDIDTRVFTSVDLQLVDVSQNNVSVMTVPERLACKDQLCSPLSIYAASSSLENVTLACSDRVRYRYVDLSHNQLTSLYNVVSYPAKNPCRILTFDLSHNALGPILSPDSNFTVNQVYYSAYYGGDKNHLIETLLMRRCGLTGVVHTAFKYFDFKFLDLTENKLTIIYDLRLPPESSVHLINITHNRLLCNCQMLWLKHRLVREQQTAAVGADNTHYVATHCTHVMTGRSVAIATLPDDRFLCPSICPASAHAQCDYVKCFKDKVETTALAAVICRSTTKTVTFPASLTDVADKLYVTGFHLPVLTLPFARASSLRFVYLQDNGIKRIADAAFNMLPLLTHLYLANNSLTHISNDLFQRRLSHLRVLDLAKNQIASISNAAFQPLPSLSAVYLHSNQLRKLETPVLETLQNVATLTLHDNPWQCECNDSFKYWIIERIDIIQRYADVMCNNTDTPVYLSNLTCYPADLVLLGYTGVAVLAPSLVAAIAIVILVLSLSVYHHFQLLRVLAHTYLPHGLVVALSCRLCSHSKDDDDDDDCDSDMFVLYDDNDIDVRIWLKDVLIPAVEPPYQVVCNDRDFIIGVPMADNIEQAVRNTRCAVALITPGLVSNPWAVCMLQAAYSNMLETGRYRLLLVLLGKTERRDIINMDNCPEELRILLKSGHCLKARQRLFWQTLHYLLPPPIERINDDVTVSLV